MVAVLYVVILIDKEKGVEITLMFPRKEKAIIHKKRSKSYFN